MAKFESRFHRLGFKANGSIKRFNGGIYETEDKEEIKVLGKLKDVKRVDKAKNEKKSESKEESTEDENKDVETTEQETTKKKQTSKKSSKSSE